MTIQEFYEEIGSDYEDVVRRFGNEAIIRKFVFKFSDDPSFGELTAAFDAGDAEKAFRASHTLKGVASNMGFMQLCNPVYELTEKLRGGSFEDTDELFAAVKREYDRVIEALHRIA